MWCISSDHFNWGYVTAGELDVQYFGCTAFKIPATHFGCGHCGHGGHDINFSNMLCKIKAGGRDGITVLFKPMRA